MSLAEEVYKLTFELPESENYGLSSQVKRSCVSIPSNIAEGSGRTGTKDFIRFLNISISSSYELETQLILMKSIYKVEIGPVFNELKEIQNMIGGFIRSLS